MRVVVRLVLRGSLKDRSQFCCQQLTHKKGTGLLGVSRLKKGVEGDVGQHAYDPPVRMSNTV